MSTVLLVRHAETAWNREGRVQGWAPTSLTDRGREQARALAMAFDGDPPSASESAAPVATTAADTANAVTSSESVATAAESAEPAPDAAADGSRLREATVDRLVTSDLRRARETAAELERATGCQPTFDEGWRERDVGNLQGLPARELFERHPRLSLEHAGEDAAHARPEGGETLIEARERVLEAWDRLRADLAGEETAVVITHSGPISLLLGHLQNDTIAEAVLDRSQDNGAVNELRIDGGGDDIDGGGDTVDVDDTDGADVRVVRENWTDYRTRAAEN